MNRGAYIQEKKMPSAVKPKFVSTGGWNKGDKLINTEKIYTDDGYYEVGCEWLMLGWTNEIVSVCRIVDDDIDRNHDEVFRTFCFVVTEKDWITRKYDKK